MVEIGPRFVLTPIRIFEGVFNGATVYANPGQSLFACHIEMLCLMRDVAAEFVSPAAVRSAMKREKGMKYGKRKEVELEQTHRKADRKLPENELAVSKVFA